MTQLPNNPEIFQPLSTNELASDRTELAKYRSRAAADRTLMAWIHTSLSLIGFGFGLPTIVGMIQNPQVESQINPIRFSVIVGLAFIGTGMLGMALGLKEHRRLLQQIQRDRYTYEDSHSAEIIGIALWVIGLISFIGVIVKSIGF
jgi:putative membrane protein